MLTCAVAQVQQVGCCVRDLPLNGSNERIATNAEGRLNMDVSRVVPGHLVPLVVLNNQGFGGQASVREAAVEIKRGQIQWQLSIGGTNNDLPS